MTRTEAHNLLNAVRGGFDASETTITAALRLTGDIAPEPIASPQIVTIPSFLNRSGRVMRGAGDVVEAA